MKKKYKVLGINYGHDSSAALGIGEEIIAACEQERYDLKKHSTNFPIDAINDCLNIAQIKIFLIKFISPFNIDKLTKLKTSILSFYY